MQSNQIVAAFDCGDTITTSDGLRDFVRYTVRRGKFAVGIMFASPWHVGLLGGGTTGASPRRIFFPRRLMASTRANWTRRLSTMPPAGVQPRAPQESGWEDPRAQAP